MTDRIRGGLAALLMGLLGLLPAATGRAAPADGHCILIDSDVDLDDLRAVAMLAPTGRVAAIVVTEGLSRGQQGAGAMEEMLRRAGVTIPVIVGAAPDPARPLQLSPRFPDWRANAERLNQLLPAPLEPMEPPRQGDVASALRPHLKACNTISLLVIGPWTSFLRYAAEILERVDRIVAQGRPYPDEIGGEPDGQNCIYDRGACLAAHDLLAGRQRRFGNRVRTDWVDIPNGPEGCAAAERGVDAEGSRVFAFSPKLSWAEALIGGTGLAPLMGEILLRNPAGFAKTSLWDDLAALYLLRRDVFAQRGGHLEPCVPAATIRHMVQTAMEGGQP